jgi:hypothetical protein
VPGLSTNSVTDCAGNVAVKPLADTPWFGHWTMALRFVPLSSSAAVAVAGWCYPAVSKLASRRVEVQVEVVQNPHTVRGLVRLHLL